jgi:hypothetical protein
LIEVEGKQAKQRTTVGINYKEDVLDLYYELYDENYPVICFDEPSKILRGYMRDSLPVYRN